MRTDREQAGLAEYKQACFLMETDLSLFSAWETKQIEWSCLSSSAVGVHLIVNCPVAVVVFVKLCGPLTKSSVTLENKIHQISITIILHLRYVGSFLDKQTD